MPDSSLQERRRATFAALMAANNSDPEDYDDDDEIEENPRPYLRGEKELGRYVCITKNWSHADGKLFYLPEFHHVGVAQRRAEEYIEDDVFEELPIKVVDLDSGAEWDAVPAYRWVKNTRNVVRKAS